MAASKSVPEKAATSGQVQQMTPFERFRHQIQGEAELTQEFSSKNVAESVIANILEAESLDDAFAAQDNGLQNGKDFIDVELSVTDFEVYPSDSKYDEHSALGVYMKVIASRLDSGTQVEFFTGAPNVVALLYKARTGDKLPLECVIKAKDTANGQLLTLRPIAQRVIRG